MNKSTQSVTTNSKPATLGPRDPADMSETERLAYITKLEEALGRVTQRNHEVADEWPVGAKRIMVIEPGPSGAPIRLNGKPYVGSMPVTQEEYSHIMEIYNKSMRCELSRMQQRGNLTPPHLLARDDISSRTTPITIANL